ncbi:metal-sensitive transcriptional regulator [Amycolatopsis thermoflava]|uniref:metal-sensitive transcriptional regulator n=1 Tax=Amycolatopsis thermoflava TaxID=84480 RepID=UPI00365A6E53
MSDTSTVATAGQDALRRRLKRAAGQVLGVERMLAEERPCGDVLIQLAAVQGALRAVAQQILSCHLRSTFSSVAAGEVAAADAAEQAAYSAGLLSEAARAQRVAAGRAVT